MRRMTKVIARPISGSAIRPDRKAQRERGRGRQPLHARRQAVRPRPLTGCGGIAQNGTTSSPELSVRFRIT